MVDPVQPADDPAAPREGDGASTSAYLPVGIVFLSVAVVFFLNESMRAMAWAFFPLGITFMVLGIRSQADEGPPAGEASSGEEPAPGPGAPDPDVTPR